MVGVLIHGGCIATIHSGYIATFMVDVSIHGGCYRGCIDTWWIYQYILDVSLHG